MAAARNIKCVRKLRKIGKEQKRPESIKKGLRKEKQENINL